MVHEIKELYPRLTIFFSYVNSNDLPNRCLVWLKSTYNNAVPLDTARQHQCTALHSSNGSEVCYIISCFISNVKHVSILWTTYQKLSLCYKLLEIFCLIFEIWHGIFMIIFEQAFKIFFKKKRNKQNACLICVSGFELNCGNIKISGLMFLSLSG